RLGSLQERNFSAANLAAAVDEYRQAVEVEPNDYRYWMELGRALEATGDRDNGEKALRRAVELAPSYSNPRWQYGNLLLRAGRIDEAFGNCRVRLKPMRPCNRRYSLWLHKSLVTIKAKSPPRCLPPRCVFNSPSASSMPKRRT